MLTNFFGKSNPVNYLIIGIFIFLSYLVGVLSGVKIFVTPIKFLEHLFYMLLCVLTMLLLDFVIRKNVLTKSNTFAILIFGCFLAMIPPVFFNHNFILANIFILLAFRRIMSLRSESKLNIKILDAAVWISIASIFYFWSLLFFVPLYIAIVQQQSANYKRLLIPIIGFLGVFIIKTAWHLGVNDSFQWFFEWKTPVGFDFSQYNSFRILLPLTVIATFLVWTSVFRILQINSIALKERANYVLMFFVVSTSILISLASIEKTGAELIFIFVPSAIVITNYIESMEEFWFREALLWLVVVLPFLVLMV